MFWAVHCLDKPNSKGTRDEFLAVHRAYLDENAGILFFSGPLQNDDASANHGSLFILNVPGRGEAEAFAANEPFNQNGVFKSVTITRMRKGRYNPELADKV
ncbi:MAG: YciI family protein [Amaricoccus sp.]